MLLRPPKRRAGADRLRGLVLFEKGSKWRDHFFRFYASQIGELFGMRRRCLDAVLRPSGLQFNEFAGAFRLEGCPNVLTGFAQDFAPETAQRLSEIQNAADVSLAACRERCRNIGRGPLCGGGAVGRGGGLFGFLRGHCLLRPWLFQCVEYGLRSAEPLETTRSKFEFARQIQRSGVLLRPPEGRSEGYNRVTSARLWPRVLVSQPTLAAISSSYAWLNFAAPEASIRTMTMTDRRFLLALGATTALVPAIAFAGSVTLTPLS